MTISRRSITVLGALLLVGCRPSPEPEQATQRSFDPTPDRVATIAGGLLDSILLQPVNVVARDGRIAVYDHGAKQIQAFDTDGRHLWSAGKEGSGPGEFRSLAGMTHDGNGGIWVHDRGNRRLTPIDVDGRVGASVRMPDELEAVSSIAPAGKDRLYIHGASAGGTGLLRVAPPIELRRIEHPWREYDRLDPLVRIDRMVQSPDGRRTYVLLHGGGFVTVEGEERRTRSLIPFVERSPLPELIVKRERRTGGGHVETRTTTARSLTVRGAAASNTELYVLFIGRTADRGRVIDRYALPWGTYLGSWLLDERANALAVDGDRLITIEGSPIPKLVIRRMPTEP